MFDKLNKHLLLVLLAVTIALIAALIITNTTGESETGRPAPQPVLAGSRAESLGFDAPPTRTPVKGRLLRVHTNDVLSCANGNPITVSEGINRGKVVLIVNCDDPGSPTPTPSPTPDPEATPTAIPPTDTPVASLPLCDEHDPDQYHGLVGDGCHYNHTHGQDIFTAEYADYPAWPYTTTISYPHQTPEENELKHEGYKSYGFDTGGECVELKDIPNTVGCIIGGRIQFHVVGGARGLTVADHSYYLQFKILNPDGSIGYIGTGGWSNFGILHCPYKTTHCPLDSDPDSWNILQPPYRASRTGPGDGLSQWNSGCFNASQVPCDTNRIASYDWWSKDDWGGVNPLDLTELILSGDPERNHSTLRFYEFTAHVDQFGPGRINFEGFTDVNGEVDESCSAASESCVYLVVDNVDAGLHVFRAQVGTAGDPVEDEWFREFDTSPIGESWIEYPN